MSSSKVLRKSNPLINRMASMTLATRRLRNEV